MILPMRGFLDSLLAAVYTLLLVIAREDTTTPTGHHFLQRFFTNRDQVISTYHGLPALFKFGS